MSSSQQPGQESQATQLPPKPGSSQEGHDGTSKAPSAAESRADAKEGYWEREEALPTSPENWPKFLDLPFLPFAPPNSGGGGGSGLLLQLPSARGSRDTFFSASSQRRSGVARSIHSLAYHGFDNHADISSHEPETVGLDYPRRDSVEVPEADAPTEHPATSARSSVTETGGVASASKGSSSSEGEDVDHSSSLSEPGPEEEPADPEGGDLPSRHGEPPWEGSEAEPDPSIAIGIVTPMPQAEPEPAEKGGRPPAPAGGEDPAPRWLSMTASKEKPATPEAPAPADPQGSDGGAGATGETEAAAPRAASPTNSAAPADAPSSGGSGGGGGGGSSSSSGSSISSSSSGRCPRCRTRTARWRRRLALLGALCTQVMAYAGLVQGLAMERGAAASLGVAVAGTAANGGGGGEAGMVAGSVVVDPVDDAPRAVAVAAVAAPGAPASPAWWFTAAYALGAGVAPLLSARLRAALGRHRALALGWMWFAAWSLIAGLAPLLGDGPSSSSSSSSGEKGGGGAAGTAANPGYIFFVVCRAMQGVGAGILVPAGLAMLGHAYDAGPCTSCSAAADTDDDGGDEDGEGPVRPPGRQLEVWRRGLPLGLFGSAAPLGFAGAGVLFALCDAELAWQWGFWFMAMVCFLLGLPSVVVLHARSSRRSHRPLSADPPTPPDEVSSDTRRASSAAAAPEARDLPANPGSSTPGVGRISPGKRSPDLGLLFSVGRHLREGGMPLLVAGLSLVGFSVAQGPFAGWATPYVYFILIIGILLCAAFAWENRSIEKRKKQKGPAERETAPDAGVVTFTDTAGETPIVTTVRPTSAGEAEDKQEEHESSASAPPSRPQRLPGATVLVFIVLASGALIWGGVGIWLYTASRALQLARGWTPLDATLALLPVIVTGLVASLFCSWVLGHARLEELGAARGISGARSWKACVPLLPAAAGVAAGSGLTWTAEKQTWVEAVIGAALLGIAMGFSYPAVAGGVLLLMAPPRGAGEAQGEAVGGDPEDGDRGVNSAMGLTVTTLQYSTSIAMSLAATAEAYTNSTVVVDGNGAAKPASPLPGLLVAQYLGAGLSGCGILVAALSIFLISTKSRAAKL